VNHFDPTKGLKKTSDFTENRISKYFMSEFGGISDDIIAELRILDSIYT
jgi:hypothetical protein